MADMTVEQALAVLAKGEWPIDLVVEASQALTTLRAELDGLREKSSRAYVAEQMRGLVPGERFEAGYSSPPPAYRAEGHNACRAETLANIERWEKQK